MSLWMGYADPLVISFFRAQLECLKITILLFKTVTNPEQFLGERSLNENREAKFQQNDVLHTMCAF